VAKTLEQIIQGLNDRHLTGDSAALQVYAQEHSDRLARAHAAFNDIQTVLRDARQEIELLRKKLDDAEKLFDAAQARLGDKSFGQAEVMAILGYTAAPEASPADSVQTFALPADTAVAPAPPSTFGELTPFAREHFAPTPAVEAHPLVAQITAAQQAAKNQAEAQIYDSASTPSEAVGLHALSTHEQDAVVASIGSGQDGQGPKDVPTTPPTAPSDPVTE
jgi:hypothetical protein